MANAQEKIEQQEEADAVADKAKEIGKDVGVEDEKKEELPDYEVIEEDDKPLAKEREERPKVERKQLTNKEKRDLRKKRVQEKFQQKDAIIEQQQQAINQLTGRLNDFEGRLSNVDRAKVDDMLTEATVNFQRAEMQHKEAFKEGDADKATNSLKAMYAAQRQIDQLKPIKQQMEIRQPMQRQESSAADPVVTRKAKDWAIKHEWYRADGSDEDSEIAKAISGKMVNEGFDPRSDDFWDELDDRLEKRNIGTKEDDNEDEEYEERPPAVRKRTSPPVSGGSKRGDVGGKVQVTLPTAYIQACKDAGYWSDPVKKARMIKRYLDGQKQNQE